MPCVAVICDPNGFLAETFENAGLSIISRRESMMRLAGRFAIITGASQGLGEEIAKHFVAEGASVIVCARSEVAIRAVEQQLAAAATGDQKILARVARRVQKPRHR